MVEPTLLNNMLVKLDHFSIYRGENFKKMFELPPPRNISHTLLQHISTLMLPVLFAKTSHIHDECNYVQLMCVRIAPPCQNHGIRESTYVSQFSRNKLEQIQTQEKLELKLVQKHQPLLYLLH